MTEPELTVRDFTPPIPVCDSGQHPHHPGETCEEAEELRSAFRSYLEQALREAYAYAAAETERVVDQWLLTGQGAGEPRGFLSAERIRMPYPLSDAEIADHGIVVAEPEPTPVERALQILDPHLRACPLYAAGPAAIYPHTRKDRP